jgi:hypothetical protein
VCEQVRHLAGVGVPQDDIARIIGCAPRTLRKRCREDLDRGVAEANATVAGYLFAAAKAGNIAAIIFWLKTRAHWRERTAADEAVPAADGEPHSEILLLPDNCRHQALTAALRDAQGGRSLTAVPASPAFISAISPLLMTIFGKPSSSTTRRAMAISPTGSGMIRAP